MRELAVCDCGREACVPGHRFGPMMRGYWLMHIVASGSGTFDNGTHRWRVRAGQGFMIFPEDITVYTADTVTPWDYVWVGFRGDDAEVLCREMNLSRENPIFDTGRYVQTVLRIAYGICEDTSLLQRHETAAAGGLYRLSAYIAQSRFEAASDRSSESKDCYNRAMWLINANSQRPEFRVTDAAEFVGLSRSQLFRIFKQQCGQSPREVLNELRLSSARRLLCSTEMPLNEVALSAGYPSAARMGEVFRETLGITPGEYRRRNSENAEGNNRQMKIEG